MLTLRSQPPSASSSCPAAATEPATPVAAAPSVGWARRAASAASRSAGDWKAKSTEGTSHPGGPPGGGGTTHTLSIQYSMSNIGHTAIGIE